MLVRAYIFPVPKKKTISMLPRWEDSTNICTLIIWRIWMEKTLKHLVHLNGIIRDHPLAEDEWWEDGVWQMLRSKLLINHTRNGLKWLPNIAVRCYQYFMQVLPYVKGRRMSLIPHLAHSWCYSVFLTSHKSCCTQNFSRRVGVMVNSLCIHKFDLKTWYIRWFGLIFPHIFHTQDI